MSRGKFLITDIVDESFIEGLIQFNFEVDYKPEIKNDEVLKIISSYSGILITTKILADKKFIDEAAQLKFILRAGSGMENIDTKYAASKKIICISSPEGNRNSVSEHVVGMLLNYFHNINKSFNEINNFEWNTQENRVEELTGKTIGIIGYGNTGSATAEKLNAFGVQLLAYDKYKTGFNNSIVKETTLQQVFDEAEIVSIHIPYNDETHYLCDENFFKQFKKEIIFINTSRGKICNTKHLVNAINSGKVKFALLDVLENEMFKNFSDDEKNIFDQLISTNKILLTPHIAGKSFQSRKLFSEILLLKLSAFI